jgi:hypothetical protein
MTAKKKSREKSSNSKARIRKKSFRDSSPVLYSSQRSSLFYESQQRERCDEEKENQI